MVKFRKFDPMTNSNQNNLKVELVKNDIIQLPGHYEITVTSTPTVTVKPELKYALVTKFGSDYTSLWRGKFVGAGVHNWKYVFNGDLIRIGGIKNIKSLEQYDVLHINFAMSDVGLVKELRQAIPRSSSTKIVANLDWALTLPMQKVLYSTTTHAALVQDIALCDMVFAPEPFQYRYLKFIIRQLREEGYKELPTVNLIPHPINADELAKPIANGGCFIPYDERLEWLVIPFHQLDPQLLIPSVLLHNLPKAWQEPGADQENTQQPTTVLLGYNGDKNLFDKDIIVDIAIGNMPWPKYFYHLMHAMWGLDYYASIHSHSRFCLEAAALGIGLVCTTNSYTGRFLYPETCHEPDDLDGIRNSIERLITDREFFYAVADKAIKNVYKFNYSHSKDRFVKMVQGEEIVIGMEEGFV